MKNEATDGIISHDDTLNGLITVLQNPAQGLALYWEGNKDFLVLMVVLGV